MAPVRKRLLKLRIKTQRVEAKEEKRAKKRKKKESVPSPHI